MAGVDVSRSAVKPDWKGQTVICIASGPSVTPEQIELAQTSGAKIVAINNACFDVRADVIYAGDYIWWKRYWDTLPTHGERWSCDAAAVREFRVHYHKAHGAYNSGLRGLQFAQDKGAKRILLIGYDCKIQPGKRHYHADHAKAGLGNPDRDRCKMWEIQFLRFAKSFRSVDVVNCSRDTTIRCFPRKPLEACLG